VFLVSLVVQLENKDIPFTTVYTRMGSSMRRCRANVAAKRRAKRVIPLFRAETNHCG
jgi:hypothetical protein